MANSILDINKILNDYSIEIQEAISNLCPNVAKEAQNELKATHKHKDRTGKFRKGWKVKTTKGNGTTSSIIYNTNAGLTQLLEKPHADRTGTRTIVPKSAGFMKTIEEKYNLKFEKDVENIIKNGG